MKPGRPLLAVGFVFICGGLIWLITGRHIAIGLGNMAIGLSFIAIGASVMRKADAATTAAPRAGGSDVSPKT